MTMWFETASMRDICQQLIKADLVVRPIPPVTLSHGDPQWRVYCPDWELDEPSTARLEEFEYAY
jgi:hypothetical protein